MYVNRQSCFSKKATIFRMLCIGHDEKGKMQDKVLRSYFRYEFKVLYPHSVLGLGKIDCVACEQ